MNKHLEVKACEIKETFDIKSLDYQINKLTL